MDLCNRLFSAGVEGRQCMFPPFEFCPRSFLHIHNRASGIEFACKFRVTFDARASWPRCTAQQVRMQIRPLAFLRRAFQVSTQCGFVMMIGERRPAAQWPGIVVTESPLPTATGVWRARDETESAGCSFEGGAGKSFRKSCKILQVHRSSQVVSAAGGKRTNISS